MSSLIKNDCITCLVRDCSCLKGCDTHTLKLISDHKIISTLKKGEKLFKEGDEKKGVFFIKKGFLRIELNTKMVLQFAGKGSIFGHRTNMNHTHYNRTATAITNITYCYIPNHIFKEIAFESTTLRQQILDQILNELEITEKKPIQLSHKTVREKIASALLYISEIYEYNMKKNSFRMDFSRQDIADLIGSTKEQVAKIMKDFEKEKLIQYSGKKFTFINTSILQSIADENAIS